MTAPLSVLKVRHQEDVTVVEFLPDHRVMSRPGIELLKKEINRVVDAWERPNFIISFEGVEYLSSVVLGTLVSVLLKVQKREGQLRLAGVTKDLTELFRLTGLRKVFQICESVDAAIKSIK